MIRLECFGPPSLTIDGGAPPPELLWRKHLALLIYLTRSPKGRTRDHLVGLFWPEKVDSKARHSLNEALRVLRRSVGDALVTDGDLIRLHPGTVDVDADHLESANIKGAFLEGFSVPDAPGFEDWLTLERERCLAAILEFLHARAAEQIAQGDLPNARVLAERALWLEPRHEPAARTLMRVFALEGARTLAIQTYERLSSVLERDYGLEPDRETTDLAERIRSDRIVRVAPEPAGTRQDMVPLFGEGRASLAQMTEVWRDAQEGRPGAVVVRGEPGTGKSRLADEIAARARLDGAVVAAARGLVGDTAADIWLALFRGGLDVPEIGGAAPEALARLAALDPDLRHRFPGGAGTAMSLDAATRHVVVAVAETRPLLLVLDDAHRVDPTVLALFSSIIQRSGGASLCVVLTAPDSSETMDVFAQHVGRDVRGVVVGTSALDREGIEQLVSWAFPSYGAEARARLGRRVLAETAGNPFLAVEFVRAVRGGLKLSEESIQSAMWPDRSRTLDQTMPGDLPEVVSAALRQRFRALSERAQAVLCGVAVIGGEHATEVLARAADVPLEEAEQAFDELEWTRWVVGDARGYGFVTELARKVVLSDMITGGQQRRIRERAEAHGT